MEQRLAAQTNALEFARIYGRNATQSSCPVCFSIKIATRPFFIELEGPTLVGSTNPKVLIPK